jgi:protein-S-isoprenylcysteine O-methyltransferase Ste14
MVAILVVSGFTLAHGVVPWAVSWLTQRHGWTGGRPGLGNLPGLVPVVAGAAGFAWILVAGSAETPQRVDLTLTPSFLLMRGPYRFTRNPMYGAELMLWLGWAIWYGSVAVLSGCVVFWAVVNFVVVPREERTLEAQFGEAYRDYKAKKPRWFRPLS